MEERGRPHWHGKHGLNPMVVVGGTRGEEHAPKQVEGKQTPTGRLEATAGRLTSPSPWRGELHLVRCASIAFPTPPFPCLEATA